MGSESIDLEIMTQIRTAKKILLSENAYFQDGKLRSSELMRRKKRAVYRKLKNICPHDKGWTEFTYLNPQKCLRCGNAIDCLTNGFVDGWN